MNIYLCHLICVFGPVILYTYWEAWLQRYEFWGDFKQKKLWKISAVISAICFLFNSIVFVSVLETWEQSPNIFLSYCVFFAGAILRVPILLWASEKKLERGLLVFILLAMSALGSLSIFVLVIFFYDDNISLKIPLATSAGIISLHCILLDFCLWWFSWITPY